MLATRSDAFFDEKMNVEMNPMSSVAHEATNFERRENKYRNNFPRSSQQHDRKIGLLVVFSACVLPIVK